jgi:hypothetical protein
MFILPHGSQLVAWVDNKCELRFQKSDGPSILQWFQEQTAELERQLPLLTRLTTPEPCSTCGGKGQVAVGAGSVHVCPDCSGSGQKGFVVPGKAVSRPAVPALPVTTQIPSVARAVALPLVPSVVVPVVVPDDVPTVVDNKPPTVAESCSTCAGKGQVILGTGPINVCPDCSGSGQEGFVVPGKVEQPLATD